MTVTEAITAFTALFIVIDPIGLAPLFIALTSGMTARQRWRIALRACTVAAGILLLFTFAGEAVLTFLGISMPAFRIAGGLLLFLTALDMLFDRRAKRRTDTAENETPTDPSVFPLALPLIAGPGAIATMILLADGASPVGIASAIGVMFSVLALCLAFFALATPVERLLGPVGINVVTRLLGMLLAALSVQFVLDGVLAVLGT